MASSLFVVTKKVSYHCSCDYFTLLEWLNDEKYFLLPEFNYSELHVYVVNNFDHKKSSYSNSFNLLTKRALVSQPSTLVVAKDSNI